MIRTYWLPEKFWFPRWFGVYGQIPKRGPRKDRLFRWGIRILWLEVFRTTPEFDAKQLEVRIRITPAGEQALAEYKALCSRACL